MVWESGGGEHFDAAFIDIFARKSNTRVRQCSKENLTINLRAFQAQKSVYCSTERVRFIFMLFMRPNAGKPRLVMEKFMYVGQKSKISSSLIDQIAAVLSVLNNIYIYYSLEYICKDGNFAQKQIRVVIFKTFCSTLLATRVVNGISIKYIFGMIWNLLTHLFPI